MNQMMIDELEDAVTRSQIILRDMQVILNIDNLSEEDKASTRARLDQMQGLENYIGNVIAANQSALIGYRVAQHVESRTKVGPEIGAEKLLGLFEQEFSQWMKQAPNFLEVDPVVQDNIKAMALHFFQHGVVSAIGMVRQL
jgi:hypothetical protein